MFGLDAMGYLSMRGEQVSMNSFQLHWEFLCNVMI